MAATRPERRRLAVLALALVLAGAGILALVRRAGDGDRGPAGRALAPGFALTTLDGAPLALEALRGKVVLLDFWATWCGPCRDEIPGLVELARVLRPRGVELVGISMDDDAAPVRAFRDRFGVSYTLALGDAALGERYGGVLGLPVKFLIDRKGRIAGRHDGPVEPAVLARELEALLRE